MGREEHGAVAPASLIRFNFHGDELSLVPMPDGDVGVALKPLCESLPVDVDGQAQRLGRLASAGVKWATTCMMQVVAEDGKLRWMLVLPRRSIPMWAATIDVARLPIENRETVKRKLVPYQDDCAEVLADHFLGRRGALPEGAASKEDVQRLHLRYATKLSQAESEKRALCEANRRIQDELDRALDASSALIAERDVQKIKRERDAVASMMVRLGRCKKPNMASGRLTVHNRVMSRWLGAGKTIEGMPREYVAEVLAMLHVLKRELEAECKRRNVDAQLSIFAAYEATRQQPN